MIKELIDFTKTIENDAPEISSWNIKPSDGLHIFLNMNKNQRFEKFEFIYYTGKNIDCSTEQLVQLERIKLYESKGR